MSEDINIIPDELKLFLCVVFYSQPNQMSGGGVFFLYIIYLVSSFIY